MTIFSWRNMGNRLARCIRRPPILGSCCIRFAVSKDEQVLQVVKTDGKVLEFSHPILVEDILVNFSGSSAIGLSKEAVEHLPPDYELKLGNVYYILPATSVIPHDKEEESSADGVKRIKIVITKQQLQQLLTKSSVSVEEILMGLGKTSSTSLDSPRSWKPKLESIPEGCE